MAFHPLIYMKSHPWAAGIIIVVGGFIFLKLTGILGGGSSAAATSSDGTAPESDAQITADATVSAAQIQAQAGVSAASIAAGSTENHDNQAAAVALAQTNVTGTIYSQYIQEQGDLAKAQIAAAQALGISQNALSQSAINSIGGISKHSKEGAQQEAIIAAALGQPGGQVAYAPTNTGNSASAIISSAGSAFSGAVGSLGSIFSDQNLKENIEYLGPNSKGVNEYAFNYKGSTKRRIGYIAQDIQQQQPQLVHQDPKTGFLKVAISSLGF